MVRYSATIGAAAGSLRDTTSGGLNSMMRSQELQGVDQIQTSPGETDRVVRGKQMWKLWVYNSPWSNVLNIKANM